MDSFKRIEVKKAQEILSTEENAILIDVRDSESYNEEHAEEAVHITNKNVLEFMKNTDKETHILVICYHGNSSQVMAQYLIGYGFTNVYSINGGYESWKNR